MECPSCGLDVLVQAGAITAHLHPDTLEPCNGKAASASEAPKVEHKTESHAAPAKASAKAPSKAAPKKH